MAKEYVHNTKCSPRGYKGIALDSEKAANRALIRNVLCTYAKEELLEEIEKLKTKDFLIIVEGKKDRFALEQLGFTKIITLSRKPLYKIIEEIAETHKDAIILTDLDREGKKLFGTLNSGLQHHGVRCHNKFREFLFKKTKLRQIEGIVGYLEKTKKNN